MANNQNTCSGRYGSVMTAAQSPPPSPPPTPPPAGGDVIGAWLDQRIANAIPLLITHLENALNEDESKLMAPLTAYLDKKIDYMETTFPPLLAQAIKSVLPHWLGPQREEDDK